MEPNRYQRGSVVLRGKVKTWYGTFREDVVTPAGTERRQRKVRIGTLTEVPTKNAALNILAKIMDIVPNTDTTFQQLATRWQTAVGPTYKKTTIDTYIRILNANVLPLFKDTRILVINNELIQNTLKAAAKDYSKSTLHMMMVVLGQILGWACKNDLIQKNPCIGIKLPQLTNTERCLTRRVISQEQIDALVAELPEPYATLVLALSQTGLRIGEAVALKKADFDNKLIQTDGGDGYMLHVTRRIYRGEVGPLKTKKSYRTLLVSAELKERIFRIASSEWIFTSSSGNPVDGQNAARSYIRPACKKLGIVIAGWHDFRHTLTTKMRKDGRHPRCHRRYFGSQQGHTGHGYIRP
jgi:integrase